MNGSFNPVLSGFSFYNTKSEVRKWFEPGSNVPCLNDHLGAVKLLDSEDGFRTGCRNISRQQESFSGPPVTQIIIVNQGTWKRLYSRNVSTLKDNLCFCRGKTELLTSWFRCIAASANYNSRSLEAPLKVLSLNFVRFPTESETTTG